ncbi:MAG: hypothetical protein KME64_42275 [Scytonematopsis contorta HA4267-MV1]|jgi:hypothetical protein|nr:hypothetical protein [Scytonematopsis contorta HA4267-MV1]
MTIATKRAKVSVKWIIERKKDSLMGKVLSYIKENDEGSSKAIRGIMAYCWLEYLLDSGESPEKLRKAGLRIISDLELEIVTIKRLLDMEHIPQLIFVSPPLGKETVTQSANISSSIAASEISKGTVENISEDDEDDEDDEDNPIVRAAREGKIKRDAGFRLD